MKERSLEALGKHFLTFKREAQEDDLFSSQYCSCSQELLSVRGWNWYSHEGRAKGDAEKWARTTGLSHLGTSAHHWACHMSQHITLSSFDLGFLLFAAESILIDIIILSFLWLVILLILE